MPPTTPSSMPPVQMPSSTPPPPMMMKPPMSPAAKTLIVILVLAVIAGLWYWYTDMQSGGYSGAMAPSATTTDQSAAYPGATPSSDTSDAALVQDSAAIDTQMSGLNSDNASMNSSDQPVTQSY